MLTLQGPPDALTRLFESRPMEVAEWGLDRIRSLLSALGSPQNSFETIHIAGTNGKGSTAAFAAAIMAGQGHRVGVYTSPHLHDITERFQVAGIPVDRGILGRIAAEIECCPEAAAATYFEVATALAFEAFRRLGVEWAVVEAGLGGRLDATNAVDPRVTTITTIGLDHRDMLGDTLEDIASEKAGIFKPGVPVVLGDMPEAALRVLEAAADDGTRALFRLGTEARVADVTTSVEGTRFRYTSGRWADGLDLRTRMVGAHQARNAALALLTIEALAVPLEDAAVVAAIGRSRVPGRFEVRRAPNVTWVLDIAHNREGLEEVLTTLAAIGMPGPRVAVVSILADKPWPAMLEMLHLDMDAIIVAQTASAPERRRWDLSRVAEVSGAGTADLRVRSSLGAALDLAQELGRGGTILVTGSTHTVGDAGRLLGRL